MTTTTETPHADAVSAAFEEWWPSMTFGLASLDVISSYKEVAHSAFFARALQDAEQTCDCERLRAVNAELLRICRQARERLLAIPTLHGVTSPYTIGCLEGAIANAEKQEETNADGK